MIKERNTLIAIHQANVNRFTVYFSPICSFFPPAIFESWLRLLRNQRDPVRIIRRRFTSSTKSPSFPLLSGLELFASISHLREARKVKLCRLELKPPILIIVALHIHFHSHDKIAIFKDGLFLPEISKILFICNCP